MWCWGRMEIVWTERVNNEGVHILHTVKEGSNMIQYTERTLSGLVTPCVGTAF